MNIKATPLYEINRRATDLLIKELGVVDTIRFFNQFSSGRGDYTKEREKWLDDLSLDKIISEIEAKRDRKDQ
jgi:hypothetical protein